MRKSLTALSIAFAVVFLAFAASSYEAHTKATTNSQTGCNERAVTALYRQILEREPDADGLRAFSTALSNGTKNVKEVVREIASSPEYNSRFVQGKSPEEAVRLLYRHILNRDADSEGLSNWVNTLKSQGLAAVVNGLVDSQEYASRFGGRNVPGNSGVRACGDGGCEQSTHAFARGFCAVEQCPNGQWSRGSAKVSEDGTVYITQGLETDRVDYGICGWVQFELKDDSNKTLAYGYTEKRCIPAKALGRARIETFPAVTQKIPVEVARKVTNIQVSAVCAGDKFAPFGMEVRDIVEGVKVILGSRSN
jgi:hypothetical protein